MKNWLVKLFVAGVMAPLVSISVLQSQSLAEKLGYPANSKLLIVHADDMGMSHSTNMACIQAIGKKAVNSGSVMVPCPWFPEIAAYLKDHPEFDAGIHLTFTSEWKFYKWGGVLTSCEIPSLLDDKGFFQSDNRILAKNAKIEEVEKEIRAQIETAMAYGIKPTHIDNHTGSLLLNPLLFRQVLKIAADYGMPLTIPMNMVKMMAPQLISEIPPDVVTVDNFYSMYGEISKGDWKTTYEKIINGLQPGLNEMIFHLSYDNDEMKAIAIDHEEFGSAWRQKDFDFVMSDDFGRMLQKNGVQLVTWRQIQQVIKK